MRGLDPASPEARRAAGLVRDRVTWQGCGPQECDGNPFFTGEVEPCINGQVAASGAYVGQDVRGIASRLLGEQLPDGGWNDDQRLMKLFRGHLLARLVERRAISEVLVAKLTNWRHPGFSAFVGRPLARALVIAQQLVSRRARFLVIAIGMLALAGSSLLRPSSSLARP